MQDKSSDRRQWRPPQKKIGLDLTEPIKNDSDETWEFVATARVQAGNQPFSGASVQFTHQGTDVGSPVLTDGMGRAKKTFTDLSVGAHTISATLVETGVSITETVRIKAVAKKAGKIKVSRSGPKGNYTLIIEVLTQDDLPVPNAKICLVNPHLPRGKVDQTTNKSGIVYYKIKVPNNQERTLRIHVLGSLVEGWVYLPGRKRESESCPN